MMGNCDILGAVECGQMDVVQSLISSGYDINTQRLDGTSATLIAVSNENTAMLEFLITSGALVDLKDSLGRTAISLAQKVHNNDIINIMKKYGFIA